MGSMAELAVTYGECIRVQKNIISINREKLNRAERKHDFEEMRRLRRLLNILYDEQSELEERCNGIREYICDEKPETE